MDMIRHNDEIRNFEIGIGIEVSYLVLNNFTGGSEIGASWILRIHGIAQKLGEDGRGWHLRDGDHIRARRFIIMERGAPAAMRLKRLIISRKILRRIHSGFQKLKGLKWDFKALELALEELSSLRLNRLSGLRPRHRDDGQLP